MPVGLPRNPNLDGEWYVVRKAPDGSAMIMKLWLEDLVYERDVFDTWHERAFRTAMPGPTRVTVKGTLDEGRWYEPGAAVRFDQPEIDAPKGELEQ